MINNRDEAVNRLMREWGISEHDVRLVLALIEYQKTDEKEARK